MSDNEKDATNSDPSKPGLSDDEMKDELKRFAWSKHFGLPYEGPAAASDASGEQKLSPEAGAWVLEQVNGMPKRSAEESDQAGHRAAERAVARRRWERATAGPNEQRTPFQEALDRIIDGRDAAASIPTTEPNRNVDVQRAQDEVAEPTTFKEHYRFWFNRVALVLSLLLKLPIFVCSLIVGWNLPSGANWYYCLLHALMVALVTGSILEVVLIPLDLMFWLFDSRLPLKNRLVGSFWGLLFNAVCFSVLYGINWLLTSQHIGNPYPMGAT
jgi:hypothetical protein